MVEHWNLRMLTTVVETMEHWNWNLRMPTMMVEMMEYWNQLKAYLIFSFFCI
jgi:hypothetical protein